jgi:FG-GAP-like repeat
MASPLNNKTTDSSDAPEVATTNTPQAPSVPLNNNPPATLDPPSAFLESTGPSGPTVSTTSSSETVTLAGSGLVFINTYGSGVTAAFQAEIIAAENYFQSQFTNTCTLRCTFDIQQLNPSFSGENSFGASLQHATYAQLVSALQAHATSRDDLAAVAALQRLSDPSGGNGFDIPIGEARILGLANSFSGTDDTIILNSLYWTPQALQNSPGDAIAVLEHELSEGAMGRIGSLGFWDTRWAPMDLFRFTASGARDFSGGRDGVATYFSTDGTNVHTGLQYHNPINSSGAYDHFDFADWDGVGEDSNDHDPFGPGGPGVGDPGTLSATDLRIMEVLGWTRAPTPRNDFNVDLKSDILLQNTNGTPQIWLMNGASVTSTALLSNPGASWHVMATGDFDVDGEADVVLQNADGRPEIWLMSGTTVGLTVTLPNPGPS